MLFGREEEIEIKYSDGWHGISYHAQSPLEAWGLEI